MRGISFLYLACVKHGAGMWRAAACGPNRCGEDMSFYQLLKDTFQKEYAARSPEYKRRLLLWRKEAPVARVERPLNLARARELGYKAKQGYVVVRVRVSKGRRKRKKPVRGRKPGNTYLFKSPGMSKRGIAEQKAGRVYKNLEVLNSYWVGEDGDTKYFEVILADPKLTGLKLARGRAFRGLTSAGKKARGS